MVSEGKRNPRTLMEAMRHFTPEVASAYVERIKWPDGPCCPKCGSINVGRIASRNRLQCREKGCRAQFSLTTGTTAILRDVIDTHVEPGSHLSTDAWPAYRRLRDTYNHEYVSHMDGEYVRGIVHTNGCENFNNCLRRSLKGTYVRATPGHLEAYVDEAVFRFNVRKLSEWERFETAMKLIVGKRLTYSELTEGAVR